MTNAKPHTIRPAEPEKRRILVVANEILDWAALHEAIGRRADRDQPAEVLVIAPALNSRLRHWLSDEDKARRSAGLRLDTSLERLRAAGIEAQGRVGDPDPLRAITDALYEFEAGEIAIAEREGHSHWLARDLVGRARRRFTQPILQIRIDPSEGSELVSESTTRGRRAGSAKSASAPRPQRAQT